MNVPVAQGDPVILLANVTFPEERGVYVGANGLTDKRGRPLGVVSVDDAYIEGVDDDGLREVLVSEPIFDTEAATMSQIWNAYNRVVAVANKAGYEFERREKKFGSLHLAQQSLLELLSHVEDCSPVELQPEPERVYVPKRKNNAGRKQIYKDDMTITVMVTVLPFRENTKLRRHFNVIEPRMTVKEFIGKVGAEARVYLSHFVSWGVVEIGY
jgi:hypothetical protein